MLILPPNLRFGTGCQVVPYGLSAPFPLGYIAQITYAFTMH